MNSLPSNIISYSVYIILVENLTLITAAQFTQYNAYRDGLCKPLIKPYINKPQSQLAYTFYKYFYSFLFLLKKLNFSSSFYFISA